MIRELHQTAAQSPDGGWASLVEHDDRGLTLVGLERTEDGAGTMHAVTRSSSGDYLIVEGGGI